MVDFVNTNPFLLVLSHCPCISEPTSFVTLTRHWLNGSRKCPIRQTCESSSSFRDLVPGDSRGTPCAAGQARNITGLRRAAPGRKTSMTMQYVRWHLRGPGHALRRLLLAEDGRPADGRVPTPAPRPAPPYGGPAATRGAARDGAFSARWKGNLIAFLSDEVETAAELDRLIDSGALRASEALSSGAIRTAAFLDAGAEGLTLTPPPPEAYT